MYKNYISLGVLLISSISFSAYSHSLFNTPSNCLLKNELNINEINNKVCSILHGQYYYSKMFSFVSVNTPFITQSSRRIFMPHFGTQMASCH